MNLIDTHTHIYQPDFDTDISDVILRAQQKGISKLLLPNIDVESIERMHALRDKYPQICYPMMGLHPTSVTESYQSDLETIKVNFKKQEYIAVGEIGIDLYWDKTFIEEQKKAFIEQLNWSIEFDLPVVIHNRDAFREVIECIEQVGKEKLHGVFHSFGGEKEELETILSLENFMVGINGVVTFKNSKLRDYLDLFPLNRIVLETDAPYLSPVPYRGKRNEPAYLEQIVGELAKIYNLFPEIIAENTTRNAINLFKFNK